MPRNRNFQRKIRRIEASYSATIDLENNSDSSDAEGPAFPVLRCSTPAPETVARLITPGLSSIVGDQNAGIDETQFEIDAINYDEVPSENVLSDSSMDESYDADFNDDEDEKREDRLWQKIISNESCKLTAENLNAILAAVQSVYKLPDVAMDTFCKVLSACLPSGHVAPSSYASVVKQLLSMDGNIGQIITYICSSVSCNSVLQKLFGVCPNSNCQFFNKKQHASGFIRLLIRPQIERIVQSHYSDIIRFLSSAPPATGTEFGDIPTTPAYSALGRNPDGNTICISLIVSSDGAQVFKLSRSSFWPCMAIVAELPPTVRVSAENAIGLGFWIGRGAQAKPNWNVFLPSIISELDMLKNGFEVDVGGRFIRVVVRLFATIFDLPAQASIWGVKQFNGDFGCIRCRHPGERHGTVCLWPQLAEKPMEKDAEFYWTAWRHVAAAAGSDYFGVLRITPLSRICNPACVNIFDSMHLVYRGNAQLILNRLFTAQPQKWSAMFRKSLVTELDSIIQNIRFPHHFDRKIPSLCTLGSFKASEIKNLLIYAILPITLPFMVEIPDFWHWIAIYVHAIRLLSQPIVSIKDADCAQILLDTWQKLIPVFCHENSLNFNSHAVLHLPDQVKRFGPLWSISTFAFEGFNGHFSRYIKASKGALVQLGRRFALHRIAFKYLSDQVRRQQQPMASVVNDLFPRLYQRWTQKNEDDRYRLLDPSSTCTDLSVLGLLQRRFPDAESADFNYSFRAASGSEVLHSVRYSSKTANIIKYSNQEDDLGKSYSEIEMFFSVRNFIYVILKKYRVVRPTSILEMPAPTNELLYPLYDDRVYGSFFYIIEKTEETDIIPMIDILCSAILIECHGLFTVVDVLPFEHD